jgi:hypothetical protein
MPAKVPVKGGKQPEVVPKRPLASHQLRRQLQNGLPLHDGLLDCGQRFLLAIEVPGCNRQISQC